MTDRISEQLEAEMKNASMYSHGNHRSAALCVVIDNAIPEIKALEERLARATETWEWRVVSPSGMLLPADGEDSARLIAGSNGAGVQRRRVTVTHGEWESAALAPEHPQEDSDD